MADEKEQPKLHIDSDWKAQAQAEKQRLTEQAQAKQAGGAGAPQAEGGAGGAAGGAAGQLPPANFEGLMSTLATQALMTMGGFPDPRTGQRYQNLEIAKHYIDLLGVLEEKCKGNLTEDEETALSQVLYELRSRYVQAASAGRAGGPETGEG